MYNCRYCRMITSSAPLPVPAISTADLATISDAHGKRAAIAAAASKYTTWTRSQLQISLECAYTDVERLATLLQTLSAKQARWVTVHTRLWRQALKSLERLKCSIAVHASQLLAVRSLCESAGMRSTTAQLSAAIAAQRTQLFLQVERPLPISTPRLLINALMTVMEQLLSAVVVRSVRVSVTLFA